MAPYNQHRVVRPDPFWPFGRCECCGKPTMYACTICGQCATEANNNKEIHMTENTKLHIDYGRRTFPDNVAAIWGARLIWPNDLVYNRQDIQAHNTEAKAELVAWLNGPNHGDGAIAKMRDKLMVPGELGLTQDSKEEVVIYEDADGKIIGSPQGSYGYVYVCGWLK